MKKEKIRLTLKEKQALKKKREKTFSTIAFVVVALAALLGIGILIYGIARTDTFSPGFKSEDLFGCWYLEDDTSCWRFDKTEDGADVYFFVRSDTTQPFDFSSYTDVVFKEEEGTVTVYYGENNPYTFTCKLKGDKLTLTNEGETMVFYKGLPIDQRNKEIYATLYPSKAEG